MTKTIDEITPPAFDKRENAWLSSHTKFRLGLTVDEILQQQAELAALRERVAALEEALKNASDKVNAAATALNYPESPEEDSPTGEAYNHGFWDCAEMAIKEINTALITAEGGEYGRV